jgi:eukaryotic-like serine/threonine-protein kinase
MPDPSWVREYQDGETVPGTPYRVVRFMGAGGMGSVYEVEHIELGRRYVLKSLLGTLTSRQDLTARMRNEWRALGQLRHPNIVDVHNAGTTANGIPFYVMELLHGETVRERLEKDERIAAPEAARIARAVLFGLEAAHSIGIVHRDVKPANVFLATSGGVKLLDFGIAKVHVEGAPKITAKGLAVGTPRYMSPEQAAGEKADGRSDVYAVGLLLYEMVTGSGPFHDCEDHASQMDAHLNRTPPRLSEIAEVTDGLSDVVASALEKEPASRPQSAAQMAEQLRREVPQETPELGAVDPPSPRSAWHSWPDDARASAPDRVRAARASHPSREEVAARASRPSREEVAARPSRSASMPGPLALPTDKPDGAKDHPLVTRGTIAGALGVAVAIVVVALFVANRIGPPSDAAEPPAPSSSAVAASPVPLPSLAAPGVSAVVAAPSDDAAMPPRASASPRSVSGGLAVPDWGAFAPAAKPAPAAH